MTASGPIYRIASGPILWYMNWFKFKGWTSLWNTIYLAPGIEKLPWLMTFDGILLTQLDRMKAHEGMHFEQMLRLGKPVFLYQIIRDLITVGYWNSPLEIEARKAETSVRALEIRASERR